MSLDGAADPLIGRVLHDSYRITRLVGQGGIGAVYEAVHVRLSKKRFAVKMLLPSVLELRDVFARFRREAEIATELGHPHIVNVIDFYETEDGLPYMVMEFLEGEDLQRRLQRCGRLDPAEVSQLARQLGSALQAAHDHEIVHRDLKPKNIFLVGVDGPIRVKLLDFGISKIRHSSRSFATQENSVLGTPSFMSPEQAEGSVKDIDHTTDIFALGSICYYALSGQLPFAAPTIPGVLHKVCHCEPAPLGQALPHLPPAVDQVLSRAMAKKKADRYPRAEQLAADLAAALAGGSEVEDFARQPPSLAIAESSALSPLAAELFTPPAAAPVLPPETTAPAPRASGSLVAPRGTILGFTAPRVSARAEPDRPTELAEPPAPAAALAPVAIVPTVPTPELSLTLVELPVPTVTDPLGSPELSSTIVELPRDTPSLPLDPLATVADVGVHPLATVADVGAHPLATVADVGVHPLATVADIGAPAPLELTPGVPSPPVPCTTMAVDPETIGEIFVAQTSLADRATMLLAPARTPSGAPLAERPTMLLARATPAVATPDTSRSSVTSEEIGEPFIARSRRWKILASASAVAAVAVVLVVLWAGRSKERTGSAPSKRAVAAADAAARATTLPVDASPATATRVPDGRIAVADRFAASTSRPAELRPAVELKPAQDRRPAVEQPRPRSGSRPKARPVPAMKKRQGPLVKGLDGRSKRKGPRKKLFFDDL